FVKYTSRVSIQDQQTTAIDALAVKFKELLCHYRNVNGFLPLQLIYFRDGVLAGDEIRVSRAEIGMLKEALKSVGAMDCKVVYGVARNDCSHQIVSSSPLKSGTVINF
ncbi:hypothetical protein HDU99_001252, partial [Rhizoclosmatium hyalinum]